MPIIGNVDPGALELSPKEEVVEDKLKKKMSDNAKLSFWVGSSSKISIAARRATFIMFWLCKFIFSSHPYYVIKPLYFQLTIKISAGISLPKAIKISWGICMFN